MSTKIWILILVCILIIIVVVIIKKYIKSKWLVRGGSEIVVGISAPRDIRTGDIEKAIARQVGKKNVIVKEDLSDVNASVYIHIPHYSYNSSQELQEYRRKVKWSDEEWQNYLVVLGKTKFDIIIPYYKGVEKKIIEEITAIKQAYELI
jgi:hypothetical protein